MSRIFTFALAAVCLLVFSASPTLAEEKSTKSASDLVAGGVKFLRQSQADDGSFSSFAGPGVTALVATSLMRNGYTESDPTVGKAIAYILNHQQNDGGIYAEGSNHRNYETCLAMLCLAEANKNGKYDKIIKKGQTFLKGLQWDDEEGHGPDSTSFGGAGYGSHSRPDLSNTTFLIDAFKASGLKEDDPAMKKALKFVSRCQNLESEHNATEFAGKVNDGGFYYTPAAGGTSQAGQTDNGGLRSYGSMTYAGLKSMIYCGVDADDPRVKSAYKWIQKNYTLEQNPGMGKQGTYYYYHTFAKALDAMKKDTLEEADGTKHDWRKELVAKLAKEQKEDGSWLNSAERWLEGDPNLVTGYCLLALSYCHDEAKSE